MDKDGLPLLLLALASYKKNSHSGVVPVHIHFRDLMKQIYDFVDEAAHWKTAMQRISNSLAAFDLAAANNLMTDECSVNTTNEQCFLPVQ